MARTIRNLLIVTGLVLFACTSPWARGEDSWHQRLSEEINVVSLRVDVTKDSHYFVSSNPIKADVK